MALAPSAPSVALVPNKSVYQIEEEGAQLNRMLFESDGELTPEIEAWWESHLELIVKKADRISAVYRRTEDEIKSIDAERERLRGLRQYHVNTLESVEALVDRLLVVRGVSELTGPTGGTWARVGHGGKRPLELTTVPAAELQRIVPDVISLTAPIEPQPYLDNAKVRDVLDRFAERWQAEQPDASIDDVDFHLLAESTVRTCAMLQEEAEAAELARTNNAPWHDAEGGAWQVLEVSAIASTGDDSGYQARLVPIFSSADFDNPAAQWRLGCHVTPKGQIEPPGTIGVVSRLIATLSVRGYNIKLKSPKAAPKPKGKKKSSSTEAPALPAAES